MKKISKTKVNPDRAVGIDALRGYAAILVVLGHSIQYNYGNFDKNDLFRMIYSFHMPLFMFISGYVSSFSNTIFFEGLKKKMLSLLVPFIAWGMVNLIILLFAGKLTLSDIGIYIVNLFYNPDENGL